MEKNKIKINLEDFTACDGELFFLTHRFKDGCFMGFWSGSPWGRVRNQSRGWVVFDPKEGVVESCTTFEWGPMVGGEGWREWVRRMIKEHGKRTILTNWAGDRPWKMTENL